MPPFVLSSNPLGSLCLLLVVGAQSLAAANGVPGAQWKVATPESQGMDSAVLAEALDFVRAKRIPLHSFLIVRNGVMVLEAYFWPYQGREVHDVASVTKSFTSTAIGLAIDQGFVAGVDERIDQFFPKAWSDADPRRRRVRLRHLLTMSSGFDCNTEGGEKALAAMRRSPTGQPMR
ncbi:MAG: serine hydrolase [Paludibaculum sp.]